eukprot:gene14056-14173_t
MSSSRAVGGSSSSRPGSSKGRTGSAAATDPAGGGAIPVVLDEAQSIKNSRTLAAHAAWALHAKHRWCLSGTPIQNRVDDLFSYF